MFNESQKKILLRRYRLAKASNNVKAFRAELIEREVAKIYSTSAELAIQRKRDIEPEKLAKYYDDIENCIAYVDNLLLTFDEELAVQDEVSQ
jgi:hypothetical protein